MNDNNKDYLDSKQVHAPSTMDKGGRRLWIYPDRRPGPRASKRKITALVLFAFYLFAPWLEIAGRPLLRIDIMEQKAFIFGIVLKMSEYSYIFFAFAVGLLLLFLVTSLRGRIWCGYACPQTVFVEWIIRPIEEWIEGPALKRFKNDSAPLTFSSGVKKVFKHACFFVVALVAANILLGFFVDPRTVLSWVFSPPQDHPTAFGLVMGITGLMYFDLAWFREQFCSFLCPYARFQSALLDSESPSVTYDLKRGEPRGKGKKENLGDCIDCGLCHRVCPTGIDIRNGLQLECIQCERCVDACDSIMTNINRPKGLVRITTPSEIAGTPVKPFWLRARFWVYTMLIMVVLSAGYIKIFGRDAVSLTILRSTGATYTTMPDGRHSNMFQVRFLNHTGESQKMAVYLAGEKTADIELMCPGCGGEIPPYGEATAPLLVIFKSDSQLKEVFVKASETDDVESHRLPMINSK